MDFPPGIKLYILAFLKQAQGDIIMKEFNFFKSLMAFALLAGVLIVSPVMAQADDDKEEGGVKFTTNLELQLTTRIEAGLNIKQNIIIPFLAGSNPLIKDNNINLAITGEFSPISLALKGELIWQPIAFLLVSGGGMAGSGWQLEAMGARGIGLVVPVENENPYDYSPRKFSVNGSAFDGLQWRAWGAMTFQFDMAAIFPGDWNHVVFQTRQEFRYAAYTGASAGESWIFREFYKENINGWNYFASYVLGYQMPQSPVLNMIGIMAELEKNLYNLPGESYWGGNLGRWVFSGLFNFAIHPRFSTTLVFQMHTHRNYGGTDFENDYYYQDLAVKNNPGQNLLIFGDQRRLLFYRIALMLNFKIH